MKKCFFFFVAFVLAVVIATFTESPVVKEPKDQAVLSYDQITEQTPETPPLRTEDESGDISVNPAENP